ncbi:MAG TPA: hypothetical protein VGR62_00725 [Candidatus Binatia bacterium]|jgi:hypothetical protein|nr:hypothetical protein [Candidatus Binatia bacterium]
MFFPSGPSPNRFVRTFSKGSPRERGPIHAVGHRVLVSAGDDAKRVVPLTDAIDGATLGTVAHGGEVEILAWQPFGANGTRYRVLSHSSGIEGWLSARSLQAQERPPAPPRVLAIAAAPTRAVRKKVAVKPTVAIPAIPALVAKQPPRTPAR